MKLVKVIGLGIAAAALATWFGTSTASAKAEYKTATGKDCATCHDGKPYKKDKLTAKGKSFQDCMKAGKKAADCKSKVN
jgi:hypothetical protein